MFHWGTWIWRIRADSMYPMQATTPMRMESPRRSRCVFLHSPEIMTPRLQTMWRSRYRYRIQPKRSFWVMRPLSLRRATGMQHRRWRFVELQIIWVMETSPTRWFSKTMSRVTHAFVMWILPMFHWGTWIWRTRGHFMWVRYPEILMRMNKQRPLRYVCRLNRIQETTPPAGIMSRSHWVHRTRVRDVLLT